MATSDDERTFLDEVSLPSDKEVCFLPAATDKALALLDAIRASGSWIGGDRPDFHSREFEMALEVMRVDDHPRVGKVTNPTLAREKKIERELRQALPSVSEDARVRVNADTGLSSEKNHNFDAYREAFTRVVVGHSRKVDAYRANHPGYALGMLIRDESSAYMQTDIAARAPATAGETITGKPHYWFLDAYFTQTIAKSGADYVVWSTPYKHAWHLDTFGKRMKMNLPTLAIYDVAAMSEWDEPIIYEPSGVISVEE